MAMKYYLSSYGIWNKWEELVTMMNWRPIAFIPNAMDHIGSKARHESNNRATQLLTNLWISWKELDLRKYFGNKVQLQEQLMQYWWVWVRWWNTFVLRQAMSLSGFDEIITWDMPIDFVYWWYSAWICVLAPSFDALKQVDDPNQFPYKEIRQTLWWWLWLWECIIFPHYKSDHPESADIDKEVEYCKANNIPYETLSDGEVIIVS